MIHWLTDLTEVSLQWYKNKKQQHMSGTEIYIYLAFLK